MKGNGERLFKRSEALPGRYSKATVAPPPPPYSMEAEQAAIGSMMQDRGAMAQCVDRMTPEHFFIPAHATMFSALAQMYHDNKAIDLITFTQFLGDANLLDSVGGPAYVTEVFRVVPTAANVQYYLEIVRDKYIAREIIRKCTELVRVAYDEQSSIGEVLEQAQSTLTEIIMESERPDIFRRIDEGITDQLDKIEYAYRHRGQRTTRIDGIATGINDFDRMTLGLRGQQLVIVGARPSQGKTALAMNFAANMAVANNVPVGVFSMEMSYEEISERLMASVSAISIQKFRDGFLSSDEYKSLPEHAAKIIKAPLWVDETPALSIASFKARARLMKIRFGVKAIVVDYLQLMRSTTNRAQDARWLEITEISGTLKAVAKELKIPVICCAQLNREAEQREFGKPRLSDLRESGSIEQDADIVVMLWRPERHIDHPKTQNRKVAKLLGLTTEDGIELWEDEKNMNGEQISERDRQIEEYAALIVPKHRNGPINMKGIRLRFIGRETRFYNVTDKMWSNKDEERQEHD